MTHKEKSIENYALLLEAREEHKNADKTVYKTLKASRKKYQELQKNNSAFDENMKTNNLEDSEYIE